MIKVIFENDVYKLEASILQGVVVLTEYRHGKSVRDFSLYPEDLEKINDFVNPK